MHNIFDENKMKRYAIILFAFSFVLLFFGTVLSVKERNKKLGTVTEIIDKDGEKSTESIVDINKSGDDKDKVPTIDDTTKKTPTKEETTKDATTTSSDTQSTSSTSSSGSSQQKAESTPEGDLQGNESIDNENARLRDFIQKTYGVTVKYGSETDGYTVGGLSVTSIYNGNVQNTVLNKLNTALSHYPNGMFVEIRNGGIPLTIYLVERYSQSGVTGVTDSNAYFANISIATAYPFEESFYHESYHYIERYMLDRKGLHFTTWSTYNPPGFNYGGNSNSELSYASNGGQESSFFVNNYAQTSEAEDRASTFEYMMAYSKASCLNQNQPIWRKAKTMAQAIDAALTTCSPNVIDYWERHL